MHKLHLIAVYIILAASSTISQAASDKGPNNERNVFLDIRSAMQTELGNTASERNQQFTQEIAELVCIPSSPDPNWKNQLHDEQRAILEIFQATANPLLTEGFTHVAPILLYGPPGTGKTYFAQQCVKEINCTYFKPGCGYRFLSIDAPSLHAGYATDGVSRISMLLQYIKRNRPCALFIDEVDALAKRGNSDHDPASANLVHTTMRLLTALDELKQYSDVLVIAATNRNKRLDDALERRFKQLLLFDYLANNIQISQAIEYHAPHHNINTETIVWPHLSTDRFPAHLRSKLSHDDIALFLECAHTKAYRRAGGKISQEHIDQAWKVLMQRKENLHSKSWWTSERYHLALNTIGTVTGLLGAAFSYYHSTKLEAKSDDNTKKAREQLERHFQENRNLQIALHNRAAERRSRCQIPN